MRRFLLLALAGLSLAGPGARGQSLPPHAWLFGTWTGGIFPPISGLSREACFSQPVVVFTRDLVMRATLTEQTLTQRVVETARATGSGVEFHFTSNALAAGLLGGRAQTGFGCASPDALMVQRRTENEIAFPGCADFPNPLVRCR